MKSRPERVLDDLYDLSIISLEERNRLLMEYLMSDDHKNDQARQAQANMNAENIRQQCYVDPNTGIGGMVRRATREENEACAVLAESHGFPELARHIRMRVSTSAIPEKK